MISKYINRLLLFTIFFICSSVSILLQDLNAQDKTEEETFKHNHVILSIGHSVIPSGVESGEFNKLLYVPIWGLSYEYGFTEKFHVGIKGEMEISNYIITDADGSELERENPASLSLLFFYKFHKDLGLFVGPGMEFEKDENLSLILFGLFYEIELPDSWEMIPELSYELKGGHTGAISIALGVGKNF